MSAASLLLSGLNRLRAATFGAATKLTIEVSEGKFDFPSPKVQGEASLFVVDDPALPPLLSAPESRWAMVNVAPLAEGASGA